MNCDAVVKAVLVVDKRERIKKRKYHYFTRHVGEKSSQWPVATIAHLRGPE